MALIQVQVKYHNMLRRRTGLEQEVVQLPAEASLYDALQQVAERHRPHLHEMIFAPDGTVATHLVVFRNGELTREDARNVSLADGDQLMLFPAISGG